MNMASINDLKAYLRYLESKVARDRGRVCDDTIDDLNEEIECIREEIEKREK